MAPKEKSRMAPSSSSPHRKDEEAIDEKPVKIDNWDGAACKNALDDAAKKVLLEKYKYSESNGLMDGRLGICTIAVMFALFALLWDYLHPFPESRPVLIICVCSYFLLMGVLTLYTTFTERGTFLVALDKDPAGVDPDNVWKMASQLKQYDDEYTLHVSFTDGPTQQERTTKFTKSLANFFDENGYLCADLFDPEVVKLTEGLSADKKDK